MGIGDPAPFQKGGGAPGRSLQFSAHVYCGQTAGWMKMALGMEVGLGAVHIVINFIHHKVEKEKYKYIQHT